MPLMHGVVRAREPGLVATEGNGTPVAEDPSAAGAPESQPHALSTRPAVDIIVPFAGAPVALERLIARLAGLQTGPADTLTVIDNRPDGRDGVQGSVRVVSGRGRPSSYYARNRGVALSTAPWLLFLDADVEAPSDLVEQYFATPPLAETAILAGAVVDKPLDGAGVPSVAARYAHARRAMDQHHTLGQQRPYAQTANCAIRRDALERVGGFCDTIRSGGDADLCFRILAEGYGLEYRPGARVEHHGRATLVRLLRQRVRHGAGAAWLDARYPGFAPDRAVVRPLARVVRRLARSARARAVGDSPVHPFDLLDPLTELAFNVGGLLSNETSVARWPRFARTARWWRRSPAHHEPEASAPLSTPDRRVTP